VRDLKSPDLEMDLMEDRMALRGLWNQKFPPLSFSRDFGGG
jgi:hypothetical protein